MTSNPVVAELPKSFSTQKGHPGRQDLLGMRLSQAAGAPPALPPTGKVWRMGMTVCTKMCCLKITPFQPNLQRRPRHGAGGDHRSSTQAPAPSPPHLPSWLRETEAKASRGAAAIPVHGASLMLDTQGGQGPHISTCAVPPPSLVL